MAKLTTLSQAVILAGGQGTRLRPLTDDRPKPMVVVDGRPFLEYLVEQLRESGIREVVLLLGYLPHVVIDHFGDGSAFGVRMRYSTTGLDDDTGTRVRSAAPLLNDHFLLMNCDNYWPLTLEPLIDHFNAHPSLISMTAYANRDGITRNNVRVGTDGYVVSYDSTRTAADLNAVDIAYRIVDRRAIDLLPEGNVSFEKTLFPKLAAEHSLAAYVTETRYRSIGSIERIPATETFFRERRIGNAS